MPFRRLWTIFFLALTTTGCTLDSIARRHDSEPPLARSTATASTLSTSPSNAPSSAPIAGSLPINPENTAIRFIGASLLNKQPGSFERFNGQLELASNDPRDARLSVNIEMNSITTKIPLLTKHLKRPDFLDVEHYPAASFVATRIDPSEGPDATHMITGDMTIHGVTRTLSVPARFTISSDFVVMDATITIRQSEFGMEKAARKTEDVVPVTISSKLARR